MSQAGYFGSTSSGATAGNRVLIQSQTAASVSSITFTTGITGYDLYQIDVYGVNTSGNNASKSINMQFSTDGGGTWENANYFSAGAYYNAVGASGIYFQNSASTILLTTDQLDATNHAFDAFIDLPNFNSTTIFKNFLFRSRANNNATTKVIADGTWSVATACNGIKIYPTAGTFETGTFKLYGIKN